MFVFGILLSHSSFGFRFMITCDIFVFLQSFRRRWYFKITDIKLCSHLNAARWKRCWRSIWLGQLSVYFLVNLSAVVATYVCNTKLEQRQTHGITATTISHTHYTNTNLREIERKKSNKHTIHTQLPIKLRRKDAWPNEINM